MARTSNLGGNWAIRAPDAYFGFPTKADEVSLGRLDSFMTLSRQLSTIDSPSSATYNSNSTARLGGPNGREARPEEACGDPGGRRFRLRPAHARGWGWDAGAALSARIPSSASARAQRMNSDFSRLPNPTMVAPNGVSHLGYSIVLNLPGARVSVGKGLACQPRFYGRPIISRM